MAHLISSSTTKDSKGFLTTEEVWEAFDGEITPDSGARNWTQTYADAKWTLRQTFTDETGGGGSEPPTYPETWSLEISTGTEPIESHPEFSSHFSDSQWASYRKWRNGQPDPSDWTPGTQMGSRGQVLENFINKQITTYFAPKIVVRHTYTSTTKPTLAAVGSRDFPSFATGLTPSGIDFIITGATCTQDGLLYRIGYEWLGSAPGGWSTFLYP